MVTMSHNAAHDPALREPRERCVTDGEGIAKMYLPAWEQQCGGVPMSKKEYELQGKEITQILEPELLLTSAVGGRVVGFQPARSVTDPSCEPARGKFLPTGLIKILYYQRLTKSGRVLVLGFVVNCRASGLAAGFSATLARNARKLRYGDGETFRMLEDNVLMNRSLHGVGAKRYKTYRNYEWN